MRHGQAQWEEGSGRGALLQAVWREQQLSLLVRRGPWSWGWREKRLQELAEDAHSLEPAPAGVLPLGLGLAGAARLSWPA